MFLSLSIPILAAMLAATPTSDRMSFSTFREVSRGLQVYADGYPASVAADDAFVQVPIAIALMRSGSSVAFTPASFTLVDARGNSVMAAEFDELRARYPKLGYDRDLMRSRPIILGLALENRPRIASNFYPPTGAGTRIARVELAPYTWFKDMIYFPRPPAGLDGVMTISVAVPGGDPVEVRFLMNSQALAKR